MSVLDGLTRGSVTPDIGWRKQDWAYEQFREWILSGQLKPGTKVDQEQLAGFLGISRIPLREALARLTAEGWLASVPHKGVVVSELSLEDARDVYGGRHAIEAMLAEAAARNSQHENLQGVRRVLERQRANLNTAAPDELQRLDRQFHIGIYEVAGMPKTLSAAENLYSMAERYVRLYLSSSERIEASFREHEAILSAVEKGDTYAARKLTQKHIDRGLEVLEDRFLTEHKSIPQTAAIS